MQSLVVIVTGASTGLGKAIAKTFLENGHKIVMNSVNKNNLLQAWEEFGKPASAIPIAGDISDKRVGQQLVATALQSLGALDVLVNNAGVFTPKAFLEVEETDLDRFWNINLKGTYFTTQAAIREMIKSGGGSVINIGTVLVDHAIAGLPATAPIVSKGGIHALTRQLAAEFGQYNIRVNTIAPGIIRTPLTGKAGVENADALAGLHLLNRIGEAEDVAAAAYYLATSNFVTGEIINVDGGHVAGHRFV